MKAHSSAWQLIAWFVFLYPFGLSVLWVVAGSYFWWRRERRPEEERKKWPQQWPPVTILVPCHNEAASIAATCASLELLDYPDFRVLFIDDASTDNTAAIIRHFLFNNPNFHLLRLPENQGKAQALNCALASSVTTSVTVVMDADTLLTPQALKYLAAPFCHQPRLGAVTGNPLALNRRNLLEKLQAAEFASIIGLIKRAQRVIGRVLTVSGCVAAYRTEVLREIGGFSPRTAVKSPPCCKLESGLNSPLPLVRIFLRSPSPTVPLASQAAGAQTPRFVCPSSPLQL